MKKIITLFLILMLLLTSCGKPQEDSAAIDESTEEKETAVEENFAASESEMFTDRDTRADYEESGAVAIQLNGSAASCDFAGVEIEGSKVTIKEEATYLIRGTLTDGMLTVDAPETAKLQLIFSGVEITNATSAPLYIKEADKVFVTLAEGTENTLSNGGSFTPIDENNIDAAIFSKQDLTFNGSGSLTVNAPAGHGIAAKDDLVFTGGSYTVTSASHGLDANDSIRFADSAFTIAAGKDGIHAENNDDASLGFIYIASGSFAIQAEGDGISAANTLQIEDGAFSVTAGGGSENGTKESSDFWGQPGGGKGGMGKPGGMQRPDMRAASVATETEESSASLKGLKAAASMQIRGGTFTIDSADDAIHSNGSVAVSGGVFTVASGDDGFHADEKLEISGGTVEITECYEGLEALDITVSGGEIKLTASDDGLNAAGGTDQSGVSGGRDGMFGGPGGMGGMSANSKGSIKINGGTLYIHSSGDGLDANGLIEISGGHTTVVGPTRGDTATLDYDTPATIKGGTFIGSGAAGMAQTFSHSEQGVLALSTGNASAGTAIKVTDSAGEELLSYAPELDFAVFIYSSPELKSGSSYTVYVGDSSGTFKAS